MLEHTTETREGLAGMQAMLQRDLNRLWLHADHAGLAVMERYLARQNPVFQAHGLAPVVLNAMGAEAIYGGTAIGMAGARGAAAVAPVAPPVVELPRPRGRKKRRKKWARRMCGTYTSRLAF
jgi:hypothetical protein